MKNLSRKKNIMILAGKRWQKNLRRTKRSKKVLLPADSVIDNDYRRTENV